jgi:L-arabinose isomerase
MSRRENVNFTEAAIWQSLDFKKVKQRLNQITDQLEKVRSKPFEIEAGELINPEDYAKLREFMEQNNLTESQAIAMIINAFFNRAKGC